MRVLSAPPPDWDARATFPTLTTGFAEASRALGYRPLYVDAGLDTALVLQRSVPLPIVESWTKRAKVYTSTHEPTFLQPLVDLLRERGISQVRIGDAVWGADRRFTDAGTDVLPVVRYRFVHDPAAADDALLARMEGRVRAHVRKAAREGVVVSEVRTDDDLRAYCDLARETVGRMHDRDLAAVYPDAFFGAVLRHLVPSGHALFLLARAEGVALAGGLFLTCARRMTHYHGASTRDRALTPKQGSTAVYWEGMRVARARGIATFDTGAVTPTDDPEHPHHSVYAFKRLWGGTLTELHGADVILSPMKYHLQERVLAPLWDHLHPVYLKLFPQAA